MKIAGYSIGLETAARKIKKKNYSLVVLQLPEGLKRYTPKLVDFLEKNSGADIIISGDPCFGACDTLHPGFLFPGVDAAVQIGHAPMPAMKHLPIPTLFVNATSDLDVTLVIEKALPLLKDKKIGLATTAQHIHRLDEVKKKLGGHNLASFIGKGDSRIAFPGQILGCNFSAATSIKEKVDIFLFIGSGDFHPLGLLLATGKQVIAADPYTGSVREKELLDLKDMVLRQRYGAIARSRDAMVFGILVGTKQGQQRITLARKIKEMIEMANKKSYMIMMGTFSLSPLEGFTGFDCFVSTACPRIAIDDYTQYKTPIITPVEVEILLGHKKWEDYRLDQILNQKT
jgi:2-(3-amino-3-carboxypropyl)histidine synthase